MGDAVDVPVVARRAAHRDWPLWGLLAAISGLLVAGVAVALIAAHQKSATYPPNSPQGTVKRYLTLLQDGRVDQAYALTDLGDTRQEFHDQFDNWSQSSHRVTLVRSELHGKSASVTVDISTFSAGPYSTSTSTQRITFSLSRHGARWRVTEPDYLPY